jgi:hypothetical protein
MGKANAHDTLTLSQPRISDADLVSINGCFNFNIPTCFTGKDIEIRESCFLRCDASDYRTKDFSQG